MDERTGRRVCQLVAGLLAADRQLHPAELRLLLKTFERFGIAKSRDDQLVFPASTPTEAARAFLSLPADVRAETFDLLIEGAVADGKVAPEEHELLAALAQSAGMTPSELDERIAQRLLELSL